MSDRLARLLLATAILGAGLLASVGPARDAAAEHVPNPADLLLRLADLPEGFAPVAESGVASLLPDGLARQAAASFRRDPAAAPAGPSYVRQVVLVFDQRDAAEYVPRFRDLMVRHQGYAVVASDETSFRLLRARDGESSASVGRAHGEILVVTTVAGAAGSVSPEDAAALTSRSVARAPALTESYAALATAPDSISLAEAELATPHLDLPRADGTGRFPLPAADLPAPAAIDVIQPRSAVPRGEPEVAALMPIQLSNNRPTGSINLLTYTRAIGPLIDEFWSRLLSRTDRTYRAPGFIVVPEGMLVETGCIDGAGKPALALSLAYCGVDEAVYIYEPFLREDLIAGAAWRERDFVVATVLAHEWGHHVQKMLGVSDASYTVIAAVPEAWPLVTRQKELQADCFAGLFARYARDRQWLNVGDLTEAQDAVFRAGDHHVESPGHHGTPEQRQEWFTRGYIHYSLRACETW